MGKKRTTAASLSKVYSSSSSSSSNTGVTRRTLSVADKLSKLRLEGLQHERNLAGSPSRIASTTSTQSTSLQVTPDVSQLLGQQYVEPQSRMKPRSRGHLAPRSWNEPIRKTMRADKSRPNGKVYDGQASLVDLCLDSIISDIHQYLGCGMNFLPAYMKARLLASLANTNDDCMWNDIVPEDDDELQALNLSAAKANTKCLKRLHGLREVTVNLAQVESAIIPALPSVLQGLIIKPTDDLANVSSYQKAYWRRLSSHFIALKSIKLDLVQLDIQAQNGLDALLGALLEGPDWREAFETVEEIVFTARNEDDAVVLSTSLPFFGFKASLRKLRRKGKHVECSVTSHNLQ